MDPFMNAGLAVATSQASETKKRGSWGQVILGITLGFVIAAITIAVSQLSGR